MGDRISRREFIKITLGTAGALSAPTVINYLGQSSPSSDKEFLEIRDGSFYLGGEEYTIKGANYLTRDHPWRMFDEYDPEQVDKELGIASQMGINTVRVPIRYYRAIGLEEGYEKPISYTEPDEQYFSNFNDFLEIAEENDIKVMPIALDIIYWEHFMPKYHHLSGEFLEKWIPEYRDDERILAWDVKNEPDLKERELEKEEREFEVVSYTKKMADKIHSLDQNHPVTIGLSDTQVKNPTKEDIINELPKYIDHEDFYSFHFYKSVDILEPAIEKVKSQTDKPVVLQEFGLPTTGEKWRRLEDQEHKYREILKRADHKDLDGTMFWELNDHPEGAVNEPPGEYIFHMGVLENDHSKKPAAHVVEQYYKWIL